MKINKIILVALALSLVINSCKKDNEGDIIPPASSTEGLFINEVYSSNPDWVELYNSTDSEIDLSDFILQDNNGAAKEYHIPVGTKIVAKSYIVLEEFDFGLSSSKGDMVKLFDANNYLIDEVTIPIMEKGKSYGRTTDGGSTWKKWDTPTKGKDNTSTSNEEEPTSSLDLMINEVVSSPSKGNDWFELYNHSDQEIDMKGMVIYDNGGVEKGYTFPAGTKIAARGLMVVETFKGNTAGPTFGLSSKGDILILNDKAGAEVDKIAIPALGTDQAYARIGNGGAEWQIFDTASKGEDNPYNKR